MTCAEPREPPSARDIRMVVLSSVLGTTMEWYDFFLYGMAAGLVFGRLHFPAGDPTVGTLLAFASFAIGFLSRPLGGLLFGHVGDRIGRERWAKRHSSPTAGGSPSFSAHCS